MGKSDKVTILSVIILVGFVFGVIYCYSTSLYLNLGFHNNSFLYPAIGSFCDFKDLLPYAKDLHPFNINNRLTLWVVYFPLAYIFLYPFAHIKSFILSYSIYMSGFIFYLLFMNIKVFYCKDLNKTQNFQNIFTITLISYPVLYILDKGNTDTVLFILLGLFVYAFKSEKYLLAAVLLAVENAFKPFPILFLLFFLLKKRYKEFFLSIILTAIMVIGGFMMLKGNVINQIAYLILNLKLFKAAYALSAFRDYGMGYASSLFMLLKLVLCKMTIKPTISTVLLTKFYDYFSLIVTFITIYFVCKEKTFWKQLTLLICNFLILPYVTYDYKLIFLFIPLWLFVSEINKSKFDLAYTILFGLLFIPKHIVISYPQLSHTMANWFSLSIIINPILLIILSLLIIYEQFYDKKKNKIKQEEN